MPPIAHDEKYTTHVACSFLQPWQKPVFHPARNDNNARAVDLSPTIIYLPGWGKTRSDNSFLLAQLASNGFTILALNDVWLDSQQFEEDATALLPPFDLSSEGRLGRSMTLAKQRVPVAADRVSRLIDYLATHSIATDDMNSSVALDLTRLGLLGYSFGGTIAAEILLRDNRFTAGLNLDGGHLYGGLAAGRWDKSYLAVNSGWEDLALDLWPMNFAQRQMAQLAAIELETIRRQFALPTSAALTIRGTVHTDFSDSLYRTTLASVLKRNARSSTELLRIRNATERLAVTFFTRALMAGSHDAAAEAVAGLEHDVIPIR